VQEIIRAYVEGVNQYLAEAQQMKTLSEEFSKHDWKPAPWTVEDTMAIGGMMGRRFGASGTDQLRNEAVIAFLTVRLGTRQAALKVFDDIAWVDDPAAITTVAANSIEKASAKGAASPGRTREPKPSVLTFPVVGRAPSDDSVAGNSYLALSQERGFLERLQAEVSSAAVFEAARQLGLPTRWGSYAWLLSPAKSASGNPLLVGGPQMGFSTPQIAHEIQLAGAGFNVMGMGFAGIPGVLIGANEHIAWTSTSGESHNEDVFVEKLKPGDPHRYLYRGSYHEMQHRVERILVKDKPGVEYDVYRTVHGPVTDWSPGKEVAYSKQMAYFGKEYETTVAFLGLNAAKSMREIPALAAKMASSHNILIATDEGDIGFWHGGFFPVYQKGTDPRLPLRGTGEDDWLGFVPFEQIPQVINPASGFIFNWNNKPGPGWKNYSIPAWGVAFHVSNLRNALERRLRESGGKLSFTEVRAVAAEIGRHNYIADWLKPGLLEAAARAGEKLTPEARSAIDYLRYWDNQAREGSVEQSIFDAWYKRLRQDIFAPTLGDLGGKDSFEEFVNPSTVYHALAGAQSSVALSRDYLGGQNPDGVRLRALDEALGQLRQENGPDMSTWGYHFEWIKFDPLPSIPWYSRGTYIQAVELARPRLHGDWILPPGQSEDPHSPHYSDQLSLAGWWRYAPMQLMDEREATQAAAASGKP
jgi:penicillin G amidase